MTVSIYVGDCLDVLKTLPAESVHCCVTSPPYWGLRDYGVDGQLGLEETPEQFIAKMVEVFREVRRVLRDDGTCWVNLGDSYNANQGAGFNAHKKTRPHLSGDNIGQKRIDELSRNTIRKRPPGLKPKDLVGIPWRVAVALQADGWYLRSDIIWHKPNPMPESVTDRPTKAHEYLFLLSKRPRYFYDADAIREKSTGQSGSAVNFARDSKDVLVPGQAHKQHRLDRKSTSDNGTRNRRTVWTIPTHSFPEAHFATFPPALVEPCIKAGTSERGVCPVCGAPWVRVTNKKTELEPGRKQLGLGPKTLDNPMTNNGGDGSTLHHTSRTVTLGFFPSCDHDAEPVPAVVLDPFGGAGTTGLVADRLGRDAILIELNPEYAEMARKRIEGDAPMFAKVKIAS